MTRCKKCGEPINFIVTPAGRKMPKSIPLISLSKMAFSICLTVQYQSPLKYPIRDFIGHY